MALAFLLTTRGIPQIFYGTEVLMSNKGTEDHGIIRSDFPGGWAGRREERLHRPGAQRRRARACRTTRASCCSGGARRRPSATAELTQYVPMDGVYVYFRHDDAQKIMVILNNGDDARTVDTQRFHESIGSGDDGHGRAVAGSSTNWPRVSPCRRAAPRSSNCTEVKRCRIVSRTALAALLVTGQPDRCSPTASPAPVAGDRARASPAPSCVTRPCPRRTSHRATSTCGCRRATARIPTQRYPVLYMHDGQNLFDPATSYGNVDWAVDEVMTDLIEKRRRARGHRRRRLEHAEATRGIHAAARRAGQDRSSTCRALRT